MKLAILTTQTVHHAKYVSDLLPHAEEIFCILETTSVKAPFDTHHPYEDRRDAHEKEIFFGGSERRIVDLTDSVAVDNINDGAAVMALEKFSPDLVIDFGTRKVGAELIEPFSDRIYNLHGGNPEEYRGLDSHLWAIYHGDYGNIATCLHRMNGALDDGDIIYTRPVDLSAVERIEELRAANTRLCVDMSVDLIHAWQGDVSLPGRGQYKAGRYYSFMPTVLKDICVKKFVGRAKT